MRKRLLKFAVLAALATTSTVWATEYRSPWISERGPIRYLFEKSDPDNYSLNVWAEGYLKGADKAFMKHGTKAHPLTNLYFNKSEFKISDAWKDDGTYFLAENHNPYVYTTKIYPRATYSDIGMDLGARWEYPVYKDKGRIGLRGTIPFRQVRVERDNQAERDATGRQDLIIKNNKRLATTVVDRVGSIDNPSTDNQGELKKTNLSNVSAYNAELVYYIPRLDDGLKETGIQRSANYLTIWNTNYNYATVGDAPRKVAPFALIYHPKSEQTTPRNKVGSIKLQEAAVDHPHGYNGANWDTQIQQRGNIRDDFNVDALNRLTIAGTSAQVRDYGTQAAAGGLTTYSPRELTPYLRTGTGLSEDVMYMPTAGDYSSFPFSSLEDIWLSSIHASGGDIEAHSSDVVEAIDKALEFYNEDIYEWLWDQGYSFKTNQTTGLGDIDLDLFYEHHFNQDWIGELMFGVRFPTGGSSDYDANPYRAYLGNGNHWVLRVGGLIAWQPLSWLNIKLDVYGAFALEGTEKRCAAFTGATVKNIGPAVNADVDWQYFVGRLDFNLFHPKTKHMGMTLGYEFYYKTKDSVKYKQSTMQSWLGRKWSNDNQDFEAWNIPLDAGVLEKNTEAIGHKVRSEGSWRATQWLELFFGGSYMFAGQNIPRETDVHGGANIKF